MELKELFPGIITSISICLKETFSGKRCYLPCISELRMSVSFVTVHLIYGPSDPVNPPATFLARYK